MPQVPSALWRQLRGVAIGVAIAIGLVVANNVAMRSMGRALDARWAAGDGIDWLAIVPVKPEPNGSVPRRLRDSCLQLTPFATKHAIADQQRFEWELGRTREKQLTTVAAFLACSAERMPERLCDARERAHFAEQLKHYVKFHEIVASGKAIAGLPQDTDWRMQQIVTRPAYEGEHERLTRNLRTLAERGYLSSNDFGFLGFGAPKELAPHIKVEAKERACP